VTQIDATSTASIWRARKLNVLVPDLLDQFVLYTQNFEVQKTINKSSNKTEKKFERTEILVF
jgi:hypothetical protein